MYRKITHGTHRAPPPRSKYNGFCSRQTCVKFESLLYLYLCLNLLYFFLCLKIAKMRTQRNFYLCRPLQQIVKLCTPKKLWPLIILLNHLLLNGRFGAKNDNVKSCHAQSWTCTYGTGITCTDRTYYLGVNASLSRNRSGPK